MIAADCAEGAERVERAVDSGAGCGVEEEGCFAALFTLFNASFEFRGYHAACGVDGDGDYVLAPEAEQVGCFFDGVVAVGGSEKREFERAVAVGFRGGEERVACDYDGGAVAG